MQRRTFIQQGSLLAMSLATMGRASAFAGIYEQNQHNQKENFMGKFRPKDKIGMGGVAIGNGFQENPDIECLESMSAAWDAGVRYFDTSPWYGLGISERRMGMFLKDKPKEDYIVSTKVGRILKPHDNFKQEGLMWNGRMNFDYTYDYTAEGTRKSVEDSLQRLGLPAIDIVFIHDLSPDNADMGDDWVKYYDIAKEGAMKELTKMREEGLIKAWGFGVNTIEPILRAIDDSDPDIFLSACQYSLIHHIDDLDKVFPKVAERNMSIVVGAPLCAGFLAGKNRYLYGKEIPEFAAKKLERLNAVAKRYEVDLLAASLQFSAAPDVVSAVIPGAHTVEQVEENVAAFKKEIPKAFWDDLKKENLIAAHAPVPKA